MFVETLALLIFGLFVEDRNLQPNFNRLFRCVVLSCFKQNNVLVTDFGTIDR